MGFLQVLSGGIGPSKHFAPSSLVYPATPGSVPGLHTFGASFFGGARSSICSPGPFLLKSLESPEPGVGRGSTFVLSYSMGLSLEKIVDLRLKHLEMIQAVVSRHPERLLRDHFGRAGRLRHHPAAPHRCSADANVGACLNFLPDQSTRSLAVRGYQTN